MLKSIFSLVLMLLIVPSISAQDRIVGVNTDELMERIPEIIKTTKVVRKFQDSLKQQLQKLEEEIKVYGKFIAADTNCTLNFSPDTFREKMYNDYREKIIAYWNLIQVKNSVFIRKSEEARLKSWNTLKDILKKIADENGYSYIIDLCEDPILPLPPCADITDIVIAKLGL